jgi:very-short-patch-repair endonuclease
MSDLEDNLAGQLRAVSLSAHPLPGYGREYQFRNWRFDFAWPDYMLAVEVDGGTWSGGRHTRGAGYERDCIKLNEAALAGWLVLRVTGAMVEDGRALAFVERALTDGAR